MRMPVLQSPSATPLIGARNIWGSTKGWQPSPAGVKIALFWCISKISMFLHQ
jgi:hypothetical protein